ncbi:MAG: 50S ribosomal protein L6 [Candidatus Harrisonbacteria bacterium CG10_big_fil_rev_8_21_14_0_10_38_8]|uniref:Large ribosomal subunit protein uL6 n=1 Tax=Candidatus Harrisonbacteria bacterium CG10_big_fil_rev_8_21_14_0_10_38_8 TaxID=1974582 RepID=A0A2M6WK71_9BACT|nr:MAG: 50S ribosomal protein L6 [Candidatus Harrisonbacteria bacterium CG10_big_fil_rev_8_21_14_0_10_38_8]
MSKIGKQPIEIPEGVTVENKNGIISVTGKNGTNSVPALKGVDIKIENNIITLTLRNKDKQSRANWGTQASLIANAVTGVTQGFKKDLEIQGVGFKARMEGKTLVMDMGFSHNIKYETPEGVEISTPDQLKISVTGKDAQQVGQVAAEIRKYKKPEPYQGKGIRYAGEQVRIKASKKVA